MDPAIDMVHVESATASLFEVMYTLNTTRERSRPTGVNEFIQADILSTLFLIGYEELWGFAEPIAETRPPW
jgi:hypothetical protein